MLIPHLCPPPQGGRKLIFQGRFACNEDFVMDIFPGFCVKISRPQLKRRILR